MSKIRDVTGMRFGSLVAIERTEEKKYGSFLWRCKCDCGNECLVSAANLTSGHRRSCGCRKNAYLEKGRSFYRGPKNAQAVSVL